MKSASTKAGGIALLVFSICGFIAYVYLLFATDFGIIVIKVTILLVIGTIVSVLAWIGYTMATAPAEEMS
jgi:hypothetical protein